MSADAALDDVLTILGGLFSSLGAPFLRVVDGLANLPFDRLGVAAATLVLFFLLRRPLRHLAFRLVGKLFSVKNRTFRDHLYSALVRPAEMLPVVIGTHFAFEILRVDENPAIAQLSAHVVGSLFIITAYWGLIALVEPVMEQMRPRASRLTDSVVDWVRKALKCVLAFFAVAAVLEHWGIRLGPLLAGMGIAGAAVALGAQALFKNLISGVLILVERRFQYGDWVKVQGVIEGTVEGIGFRSTRIRQFDDAAVQVPNSDLADNAVINYTQMRRRRIFWLVGVTYSTSVDQLKQIRDKIESHIHTCADFVPYTEAATFVRIDSFGQSSINIMVYCFTHTTNWGEWLAVKERLAYVIMDIVLGAGSGFAFPSTSLYVESLPGDGKPEPFPLPEAPKPAAQAPEAANSPPS